MTVERSNFWLQNGQLCKQFCKDNNTNLKHWKRTKEAQTLELRLLLNSQAEDDDMQQERATKEGESLEDDRVDIDCHDDTKSHPRGGPMKGLKSFRGLGHWDDGLDSECILIDDEEEEDKEQFWCAPVSTSRQECIGLTQ